MKDVIHITNNNIKRRKYGNYNFMESFDRNKSSKNLLLDLNIFGDSKKAYYRKDPYAKEGANVGSNGLNPISNKYHYLKEIIESTADRLLYQSNNNKID